MKLMDLFKRKARSRIPNVERPAVSQDIHPKNGRLTLAVLASLVLMAVLVGLNVRLVMDPSIASKAFGPAAAMRQHTSAGGSTAHSASSSDSASEHTRPEVTFYRNLTTQEEDGVSRHPPACEPQLGPHAANKPEPDQRTGTAKNRKPGAGAMDRQESMSEETGQRSAPASQSELPKSESGPVAYMVQVGAFTDPSVAQQWAAKWKSRGYDVTLKPVARPKTGVLYRLYLGQFQTEQEADALVNRLKAKEGITAFRLMVRK